MEGYAVGIDIGGTKCAVILGRYDKEQEPGQVAILDKIRFETEQGRGYLPVIEEIFRGIDSLLTRNDLVPENIGSIGISCGGPLDSGRGMILSPPNLPGWDNVPIVSLVEKRYQIKTYLQNDANACALAEHLFGAARGYRNAVFLTFGTGIGAGLIINGELYSGSNDMAGEIGHMRMAAFGPVGYGKEGSFEGFCSGGGIAQLARSKVLEAFQKGEEVSFCRNFEELDKLTAKGVAEAAGKGDVLAAGIFRLCGEYLGRGLSVLIDILNPEIIVLGSIYIRCEELLKEGMQAAICREALETSRKVCRIVQAQCGEAIGDYGALSVALTKYRKAQLQREDVQE